MKLTLGAMSGEIPRLVSRLLPNNAAQSAFNTRLDDGALTPIRMARKDHTLSSPALTIFKNGENWLSWNAYVDVARGPIAEDRIYYTGDGEPKMLANGTTYDLKVPAPTTKPTVSVSGTLDPDLQSTILYVYTWVTEFDEESEPSPISDPELWSPSLDVTLSLFDAPPAGRGIDRMRIYRSQTSDTGDTQLYFIAERAVSTTDFVDSDLPIVEPIPSTDYNQPPDDLKGIISLPNGMVAGFRGRELCFCEPYILHAWPEKYRLTTDYDIVALGAFGSSIAVMTTGNPYIVQGTAPENMVMEKLELNLPCISATGVVDLGYSVAYPSHNGLVMIGSAGATVATANLFTRTQWLEMNPYTFVAGQFSGRYMASYEYTDRYGIERRGIMIIDTTGEQPFLIRGNDVADAMHYDIETGSLYFLRNGVDIYEWDAQDQPFGEQLWRSKLFVLPTYTNFGAILIEGQDVSNETQKATMVARQQVKIDANQALIDDEATQGDIAGGAIAETPYGGSLIQDAPIDYTVFGVTIYADGKPVAFVDTLNEVARLPAGFLARTWEIEVRGNIQIQQVTIAASPTEIAGG